MGHSKKRKRRENIEPLPIESVSIKEHIEMSVIYMVVSLWVCIMFLICLLITRLWIVRVIFFIICAFLFLFFCGLAAWLRKLKRMPEQQAQVTAVKKTKMSSRIPRYYVDFLFADGSLMQFNVGEGNSKACDSIQQRDTGKLIYKKYDNVFYFIRFEKNTSEGYSHIQDIISCQTASQNERESDRSMSDEKVCERSNLPTKKTTDFLYHPYRPAVGNS